MNRPIAHTSVPGTAGVWHRRGAWHKSLVLVVALCTGGTALGAEQAERRIGVRQGPDKVFEVPVTDIVPALAGARPTRVNGRVGGELVFWGYDLADGRRVNLFACALLPDVDCAARVQAVCVAGGNVLESREVPGKMVHRVCRPVSSGPSSTVRPGCSDNENEANLLVG
ncbi:MAG TPA: hypothetical protein VFO94_18025, partial [Gammaproteobacteria bacterium]|nr:hypothetical protein [Gammaproteobacteria bacterium]